MIRFARYDWVCGKHSGIPACCRLWFIGARALPLVLKRAYWDLGRLVGGREYVPCPRCLVTGRGIGTVLRECECDGITNGELKDMHILVYVCVPKDADDIPAAVKNALALHMPEENPEPSDDGDGDDDWDDNSFGEIDWYEVGGRFANWFPDGETVQTPSAAIKLNKTPRALVTLDDRWLYAGNPDLDLKAKANDELLKALKKADKAKAKLIVVDGHSM